MARDDGGGFLSKVTARSASIQRAVRESRPTFDLSEPVVHRPLVSDTKETARIWNDYSCAEIIEAIVLAGYEVRTRVDGPTWHVSAYLGRWRLKGPKASGPSQRLALARLLDRVQSRVGAPGEWEHPNLANGS